MISTWLLALALISAHHGPLDDQDMVMKPQPLLEVSGPTYFSNGEIGGATVGRAVKLNQSLELYQVSGRTLCQSASATSTMPPDAGSGWRLLIVPLKIGPELVLSVSWQRLWERGSTLTNGPKGFAVVTLQPGKRLLLDYITAGELVGPNQGVASRPGDPNRPPVRSSPGCGAIGMGLQIGYSPVESQSLVETNLWLVRTLADGSERVRQQTVRVRAGAIVEFFFDDETIVLNAPKPGGPGTEPPAERRVRTSGRLGPLGIVGNGQVRMELMLAQYLVDRPGSLDRMSGGSATYEFTAGREEVVAFRVPQVSDDAGRLGERMSLRVQMKVLNR